MKKTILLAAVAALMSVNAFAQKAGSDEKREERIEARAERIAERMGLDDKTEDKFESDYKKMMKELYDACRCPEKTNPDGKKQNMTDAEAKKCLQNMIEVQQKRLEIVRDYSKKMGKYLNEKQVLQVMRPVLHQGKGDRKNWAKGKHQHGNKGKYQQAKPSRDYDCLMRCPAKK